MTEHSLFIRNVDDATYAKVKNAAAARGMTLSVYLAKLVELHERIRTLMDEDDGFDNDFADVEDILHELGLQTVTN